MKKLWLLERRYGLSENDNPWIDLYECNIELVVRASTRLKARYIAQAVCRAENSKKFTEVWLNAKYSICKELKVEGDTEVICINNTGYEK